MRGASEAEAPPVSSTNRKELVMKRLLFLLAAVAALSALALSPVPTRVARAQSGISTSQWYHIVARNSGKCLDVAGGQTNSGARLVQHTCHQGDNQTFQFQSVGSGLYYIIAGNSGLCIDQVNATYSTGHQFMQWPCHTGTNQQFDVISGQVGSGYYNQIRVQHSLLNMDVANGSTSSGAYIVQYTTHGGTNQQFELVPSNNIPCAGTDDDEDGMSACYDCDDNDPNVQDCPIEDPPCEFCCTFCE
jgi:Ricin-type beta-trefoil lectin domain-like